MASRCQAENPNYLSLKAIRATLTATSPERGGELIMLISPMPLCELVGSAAMAKWFATYEGGCSSINAVFADLEARFLEERAQAALKAAPHPADFFDGVLLNVYRRQLARELITAAKEEFHSYIIQRSQVPVELPAVTQRQDHWDRLVDARLRQGAA